ncbi:hypothetical protein [Nocardia sp. BMG51109]|uniref:hypothetical protein n=1 Tax=Nocardia sp. BMG51109 TaxID=1056816 RepID=UPI00046786B8|nr:hypothetical protein [Nocardia sp. BMG51109]
MPGSGRAGRRRSAAYRDAQRLAADWDDRAARSEPFGLIPVVIVDTARPVECADLVQRIERATWSGAGDARAD